MKRSILYLFQVITISINFSCSGLVDKFKDQTWTGHIYRMQDQKDLSKVMLKFKDDSLYIYSNAIYGSENDTLTIQGVNEKDSTIQLKNMQGEVFSIFFQSAMLELFNEGRNSKETLTYTIKGNRIYFDGKKGYLEIKENGNVLVMQEGNMNLVLTKIY